MTNYRFVVLPRLRLALARSLGLIALLAMPLAPLQAQGLKAATQLRLPDAAPRASASTSTGSTQRQADFIVAVVNSEPITNSEVRTKLLRAEQQLSQQGAPMPPRAELAREVLERLITDKAQLQLARESGIRVDDGAVEGAVQTVARQNQISVDELRQRLRADGIAYSQFKSDLRDELMVSRLRQREIEPKAAVSELEIDQFLREQEGKAGASALELNLAQILVPVPENASAAQVAALQAKAQQVADRARAGTDFTALVNEFSDAAARAAGGQMGLRSADRYPPLFVEATAKLRTGDIAGPLRSGAGFHVLKVIEKKQAGMPSTTITQTHARHILLPVTPQQSEAAAIKKLTDFKRRIEAGQADFATLARENSIDGSAKEGGDLGWANPGMFVPEFEKAMNGLAVNGISEPVVSRFGVHLIQVTGRRDTQLTQREMRDAARNILREKKLEEAYAVWLQEVRGRAYVEYREAPQ
ncbi:peptidylprolyl isomerase [Polaromonas sp.]|jgi:peptidyl-prolyl cis-trans isomerase SurA|uniref:peptidylprolyl isomerase n=1 Tax=Polaromonas sp. TaxID=1869339 RepID=UPI002BBFD953|nr:peptidylprolyl isomerase [Polaromonas sp.]HQS32216.1 peptidylprolyl isomerase [Polaromonas sp.]HQS91169.1 peptidylprolyl isomerase [Polaromonas sp.]